MILAQVGRFAGVGLAATLLHVVTALLAQYQLGLSAQQSNFAGFCAAVSLSYMGHSQYTFRVKGHHVTHFNRFLLVSLAGLALSASITQVVHVLMGAPFIVAMGMVAVSVPTLTFMISKYWTFTRVAPTTRVELLGIAAVLGLGTLCFLYMQTQLTNHDTVWYLIATRKWLEGMRLYTDLVEVNPPLNFYYTAPAIWIADATGLDDMRAQTLLTTGMMSFSLLWVWQVLQNADTLPARSKSVILAGSAAALFIPFLGDFAQREHTLMIFLLPYLTGIALQGEISGSRVSEACRAVFAGLGLCLKPYFMLIPAAITLLRCLRDRSLRPVFATSNWIILAMGIGYVVLVRVLHPEYLNDIVPMALQVYGAYGFSDAHVILVADPSLLLVFAVLTVLVVRTGAFRHLTPMIGGVVGAVAAYGLQWTGYGYQATPFMALIVLGSAWVLANRNAGKALHLLSVICLCIVGFNSLKDGPYKNESFAILKPFVDAAGPTPNLAVLSTQPSAAFPLALATGANWTSRYPALWLIPGALNRLQGDECRTVQDSCDEVRAILLRSRTDAVTDLINGQPDLLIVDHLPRYFDDPGYSHLEFLAGDARFAPFLSTYGLVTTVGDFSVYRRN